jgi:hypothetical protein
MTVVNTFGIISVEPTNSLIIELILHHNCKCFGNPVSSL